jgi:hypothetical protein
LEATRDLVVTLFRGLNHAFNEEPDLPKRVEHERIRLSAALLSIARTLGKNGFDLPFADRFFELAVDIADLNSGFQSELFKILSAGSRKPPDISRKWIARAQVVLGQEAIQQSSSTKSYQDIAREIETKYPKIKKLVNEKKKDGAPRQVILPDTIAGWRKEFKRGKVKQPDALEFFNLGMLHIAKLKSSNVDLVNFGHGQLQKAELFMRATLIQPEATAKKRRKVSPPPKRDKRNRFE